MKTTIDYSDFDRIDMRTGTVVDASPNKGARKPAYVLEVDFGELGVKTSSAQITENYRPEDLVGMQVVAVVNFSPKKIAGVTSEVLVLGAMSGDEGVVLLQTDTNVANGVPVG